MTPPLPGVSLAGIVLTDAISGRHVDLGVERTPTLLTLIRHRF
ncbi:MAG TPA: hypothetical protein VNN74_10145 [Candidatus Micrarchaeia archaeon]|nr:hypothetical protein [Candidatus Micrarchaeia archaeon]